MHRNMGPSRRESPMPTVQKRGSWAMLADMATEMVNGLDLGDDDDYDIGPGPSTSYQRKNSQQSSSGGLPSISVPVQTKGGGGRADRRGSGALMNLFSAEDDDYDYDPSTADLKSQARQQQQRQSRNPRLFSSLTSSVRSKNSTATAAKKDPLMQFHERHNRAENEYRKQEEARRRRQQLRDHDDDKSIASSNSFFDFLTRAGAADDLYGDGTSVVGGASVAGGDASVAGSVRGGGMKRSGSQQSMNGSTHSMASFFSLFGDDDDEIAKLSAPKPARSTKRDKEDPSLQAAVKQSKSVKGQRVFVKGKEAAETGDWKKAVAYYHIALVKQRAFYGEDHLVTSNTLNSLGVALMNLGEHFGALTALEESLHIRQEKLGAGAEEVAETTSNIWQVLKASQEDET